MIRLPQDLHFAGCLGSAVRARIETAFAMELHIRQSISGLWSIIEGAIKRAA